MEHRAVALISAGPVVPLDAPLEALALRHPHHVHQLTRSEQLHRQLLADLVGGHGLGLLQPHLAQESHRLLDACLLVMARHGLGDVLPRGLEAELQGVVAVFGRGPDSHHRAGPCLDDGHLDHVAVIAENLGHAPFPADQPFLHGHG